jgi:hypothetical protein
VCRKKVGTQQEGARMVMSLIPFENSKMRFGIAGSTLFRSVGKIMAMVWMGLPGIYSCLS